MKFVVTTQFLENYGAHCESGKFVDGNAYWKMKGGVEYAVSGLDRIQDAVAFVAALAMQNSVYAKEFPVEWKHMEDSRIQYDSLMKSLFVFQELFRIKKLHKNQ